MPTVYEQAARLAYEDALAENPETEQFIWWLRRRRMKGDLPQYWEVFGQHWRDYWDDYEVWCGAQLDFALRKGDILLFKVPMLSSPVGDAHVELNQQILDKSLDYASGLLSNRHGVSIKLRGVVTNGTSPQWASDDGGIAWTKDVPLWSFPLSETSGMPMPLLGTDTPGHSEMFSLEVGYTKVAKTYVYLKSQFYGHRIVARWPYDSSEISILWYRGGESNDRTE